MWARLLSLTRVIRHGERFEQAMSEELQFHVEARAEALVQSGLAPEEALRQARVEFGGVEAIREECRDATGRRWSEDLRRDLAHGVRVLRRRPAFVVTAVLSLALGTGTPAAVFQLLDATVLRALPVADPQELVEVGIAGGTRGFGRNYRWNGVTYPLWEQIRDHQRTLSGVFAWTPATLSAGQGSDARPVRAAWVSGAAFATLEITAERGRLLTTADDRVGCPGAVVLSHGFWQREFGGANAAIGQAVVLNGRPLEVIGVAPPAFHGIEVGQSFDVALPFCVLGAWDPARLEARDEFWLRVFGRTAPGATPAGAARYLEVASVPWFEAVEPSNYTSVLLDQWRRFRLTADPRPNGVSRLRDVYEVSLWWLLGITALILVMTSVNLANLTLAKSLSRGQEVATRLALGASRARVVSQLWIESLIVAVLGTAGGAVLAGLLARALIRFLAAQGVPIELDVSMGWRVATFLLAVGVASCVLFGLSTAIFATRRDARPLSDRGARRGTAARARFPFQQFLIASQAAVSLVLVVASFSFVASLRNLLTADAGFRQEGLFFSSLDLRPAQQDPDGLAQLKRSLLDEIRAESGVEVAATTTHLPLNGGRTSLAVPVPGDGRERFPQFNWVSPGYFDVMGIPLRAGRDFTAFDRAGAPPVLVVNEQFVREFFAGTDAIGRTIESLEEPGFPRTAYEIVGVVGDTKYADLREARPPIAYAPDAQEPTDAAQVWAVTRTSLQPSQLTGAIRRAADRVNAAVVTTATVDLRASVVARLMRERLLAWLAGFFGFVALGLVGVGLYGVVSYLVSNRRREIGIRMALGADRRSVVRLVCGQTISFLMVGCAIGIAVSVVANRLAEGLLFGVTPADPLVVVTATAVLMMAALGAAYLPGREATRTNPAEAMRLS
jgi:predicted permease